MTDSLRARLEAVRDVADYPDNRITALCDALLASELFSPAGSGAKGQEPASEASTSLSSPADTRGGVSPRVTPATVPPSAGYCVCEEPAPDEQWECNNCGRKIAFLAPSDPPDDDLISRKALREENDFYTSPCVKCGGAFSGTTDHCGIKSPDGWATPQTWGPFHQACMQTAFWPAAQAALDSTLQARRKMRGAAEPSIDAALSAFRAGWVEGHVGWGNEATGFRAVGVPDSWPLGTPVLIRQADQGAAE